MKYHDLFLIQVQLAFTIKSVELLPPASAVEIIEMEPFVCVCVCVCVCVWVGVCLFVSALTAEPFDIWSRDLVQGLTLIISRTSLLVKVIGQGHEVKKKLFPGFLI